MEPRRSHEGPVLEGCIYTPPLRVSSGVYIFRDGPPQEELSRRCADLALAQLAAQHADAIAYRLPIGDVSSNGAPQRLGYPLIGSSSWDELLRHRRREGKAGRPNRGLGQLYARGGGRLRL